MTPILLVAHAPLATALLAVAQHAFPECGPQMLAIDVSTSDDSAEVESAIKRALRTLMDGVITKAAGPQEVMVLVDVFGATPCNAVLAAAEGYPVRVVTGVSIPMLWRVLGYDGKPMDELVASAVAGAAQGAFHAAVSRRQNQSTLPSFYDQDNHHHHQ